VVLALSIGHAPTLDHCFAPKSGAATEYGTVTVTCTDGSVHTFCACSTNFTYPPGLCNGQPPQQWTATDCDTYTCPKSQRRLVSVAAKPLEGKCCPSYKCVETRSQPKVRTAPRFEDCYVKMDGYKTVFGLLTVTCPNGTTETMCSCNTHHNYSFPPGTCSGQEPVQVNSVGCASNACPQGKSKIISQMADPRNGNCCPTFKCVEGHSKQVHNNRTAHAHQRPPIHNNGTDGHNKTHAHQRPPVHNNGTTWHNKTHQTPPQPAPSVQESPSSVTCWDTSNPSTEYATLTAFCADNSRDQFCSCNIPGDNFPAGTCGNTAPIGVTGVDCTVLTCSSGVVLVMPSDPAAGICCPTYQCNAPLHATQDLSQNTQQSSSSTNTNSDTIPLVAIVFIVAAVIVIVVLIVVLVTLVKHRVKLEEAPIIII